MDWGEKGRIWRNAASLLVIGLTAGLVCSGVLWGIYRFHFAKYVASRQVVDHRLVAQLMEAAMQNPEVQQMLREAVGQYLRSPEGVARVAEMLERPEFARHISRSVNTPEFRAALLEMMQVPEFRREVLDIVRNMPEMQVLKSFDAIVAGSE